MAGYSGTPLIQKLGIKPGYTLYIAQPPAAYFDWLSPMPAEVVVRSRLSGTFNFIHLFATHEKVFRRQFVRMTRHLDKSGMLWVSWPKKTSKVASDLDENIIRRFGLDQGMVDIKVCAVNEIWSGLKFVYRVIDR
jgi:hypothetical protein